MKPIDTSTPIVAPSLLSCDFARLADEVQAVERAGADWLHVDVMDGHFVPNITIGPVVVEAIKRVATVPLDVHLMITQPAKYVAAFAKAGANVITVHAERDHNDSHLSDLLAQIRDLGCKAGLCVSPQTPVEWLLAYLDAIDLALVMTVHPGFGGQSLIPECLDKVRALRADVDGRGLAVHIEVDGGINAATVGPALEAGADVIVAGSYVFGAPDGDYAAAIRTIREAAAQRA